MDVFFIHIKNLTFLVFFWQAYLYLVNTFLQTFLTAGQDGLHLIATAVLPVLFPFFVLTSLILNLANNSRPWLAVLLSYFSGYPNGARLTQDLYLRNRINLKQAQNLSIITSTPSPIFVIATAGTIFLHDIKLGCVIFFCTVGSALINGLIWRTKPEPELVTIPIAPKQVPSFFEAFSNALSSATSAIINVCGVILFFYITTRLLNLGPILTGILEMTSGVAKTTNPFLVQFFVTFGGLSVAMQQQIFMQNFQIKFQTYLVYKITHALLACALLAICLLFLN